MELIYLSILNWATEVIFFLILCAVFGLIFKRLKNSQNRLFNPLEYFPEDELHTLRQIYFLIMMALLFMNIIYSVISTEADIVFFGIFDILISLYMAVNLKGISLKNIILFLLLVPYGSLTFIFLGNEPLIFLEFLHIPVFIYFIKVYYDRFKEYTEANGLGIAIILLFILVFVSFFITQIDEGVNPLDALVMVSNAFTSNGYAVLGSSIPGKINSVFLVWGGYILSGVGTATLTAAILMRHFNHKFDELEELIKKNNEK